MKLLTLIALAAGPGAAFAGPVAVVRPITPVIPAAPMAASTSASNQSVLTGIINRLDQNRVQHAIAVSSAAPAPQPAVTAQKVQVTRSK